MSSKASPPTSGARKEAKTATTDRISREIMDREDAARIEKTRRLRDARIEAQANEPEPPAKQRKRSR
ncbi:hypothetical protein [Pararhizobium mangrovi]|uniref:Uncharacterized protein n=1 Tax=Pararhizobium mangrovi TaxID=2590452 RepID=A0A506UHJ5_9HYPH|nr:hypothetical protein [Pararhizobium mangrovi]TPW32786.1 hypothetical protein FJU11_00740 [Pararhizobium mangrovi]